MNEEFYKEVLKKHIQWFPRATMEIQMNKLNEEFEEFYKAETQEEKEAEAGDVLLVVLSLLRFENASYTAALLWRMIEKVMKNNCLKTPDEVLADCVTRMEKRIADKAYYFENGAYYRKKD